MKPSVPEMSGPSAEKALDETLEDIRRILAERDAELHHQRERLQALYKAEEQLHQQQNLEEVLQALVDVTVDVMKADKSSLLIWDSERAWLKVRSAHGFGPDTMAQMRFRPGEGLAGQVAVTGEPAIVPDTAQSEQLISQITKAEGIRALMHLPLQAGDQIFGVFNISYLKPRDFTEEDRRIFGALAQRVAMVLYNAQLFEAEQQRRRESERRRQIAESLRETLSVLNSGRPLAEILDYIVTQASHLMGAAICTLHHIDYQDAFVEIEASHGLPDEVRDIKGFPLLSSSADELILNRKPVVLPKIAPFDPDPAEESSLDPRIRRWRRTLRVGYPAYLAVPLVVAGEVYGSMALFYTEVQHFSPETIDLAMALGEQAALAIDNARLRLSVEQAAVASERSRLARELHDAVTQTLFSASLIAEVLPRIWQRDPQMGLARLEELRELTRGALAEMRTLLLELRPASLLESPLDQMLRQLAVAAIGRSRLKARVEVEGARALPPDVHVALYRITQEALNNVIKHAGASKVAISLRFLPGEVELAVSDDGRGFDPGTVSSHSLGQGIMKERAASIGADLQIDSVIGEGTTVRVRVSEQPDAVSAA